MQRKYERLRELLDAGDRDAAHALWLEASRSDDRETMALVAITTQEAEAIAPLFLAAWAEEEWERCASYARHFGFELDETLARAIDARIERANGRRNRRIDRMDVIMTLFEARMAGSGVAMRESDPDGKLGSGKGTLCLAVYNPETQVIAVDGARCSGRAPSPGTAWNSLHPWRKSLADNRGRLDAWAAESSRLRVIAVGRAAGVEAVAEERRRAHTPEGRFATLLAGPPDIERFKQIVKMLDKTLPSEALAEAESALETWPDRMRLATRAWWRAIQGKKQRPTLRLYRQLELSLRDKDSLDVFDRCTQLEVLRSLRLDVGDLPLEPIAAALAGSPHLQRLRQLHIIESGAGPSAGQFEVVSRAVALLPEVETLTFQRDDGVGRRRLVLDPESIAELPSHVRDLGLRGVDLTLDDLDVLSGSPRAARLRGLDLWSTGLESAGLARLLHAPHLRGLERLNLVDNTIPDALQLLAASPIRPSHLSLSLAESGIEAELEALSSSGLTDRLTHLTLSGGPTDLDSLLASPALAKLEFLFLRNRTLSLQLARDIAAHPSLRALRLTLSSDYFHETGLEALGGTSLCIDMRRRDGRQRKS